MQCAQCGEQLPSGAHFCGQCGARVEAEVPAGGVEPRVGQTIAGQTIAGRYRLLRQVGEGGMGTVYEAEQTLGTSVRAVAVKLLRPEWSQEPSIKARFHREAATVARLEHFNTVRIYDFGATETGTLFIVMEFLHGRSLQSILDEQGALAAERVLHLVNQAAASLDEAHRLGIVHRDLKPDNFLLIDNYASQRDVVKLVDFGIAKGEAAPGTSATQLTELGAFVGTPGYMSPEQFIGGGVSAQSDIYSLGVTTYQMLSGRLPFEGESVMQWAQAHLNTSPPPLEHHNSHGPVPEAMRAAVSRALSKNPSHRQTTALDFARELAGESIHAAVRSTAPVPSAAPPPSRAEPSRPPDAAAGAVVASGSMKTAPMAEMPDIKAAASNPWGTPTTQPMAQARPASSPPAHLSPPPPPRPASRKTGRLVALALLVPFAAAAAVTGFFALRGYRVFPWQGAVGPDIEPPPLVAAPPASESPEPAPPREEPPPAPAPEPSEPPAAPSPPPRPSPPRPSPSPSPPTPAPGTPSTTPALPSVPGLPLPGAGGAPATQPAPPMLPTELPWNLPTAGACERCLAALRGGGNYSVVTAIGENLLCEDRAARDQCEAQIIEQAPIVAERAARSGDCPAALATVAASINVRIPPERFREVNALCLR